MPTRQERRAALAKAKRRQSWAWEHRDPSLAPRGLNPIACLVNDLFSVQVYENATRWGLVTQLSVRRHDDREPSWADLQRIKDTLIGAGRVAVQVYPPAAQLVDQANMYHLWVLPAGLDLPFGLHREESWGCPISTEPEERPQL